MMGARQDALGSRWLFERFGRKEGWGEQSRNAELDYGGQYALGVATTCRIGPLKHRTMSI